MRQRCQRFFSTLLVAFLASALAPDIAAKADIAGEAPARYKLLDVKPRGDGAGSERPLTLRLVEDLLFGRLGAGSPQGGVATIDAATGQKKIRGGVVDVGGYHSRAEFIVQGAPQTRFTITLPDRIDLAGKRGRAILTNFRSFPVDVGVIGPDGRATVYVGAELRFGGRQPGGEYRGSFGLFVDHQ